MGVLVPDDELGVGSSAEDELGVMSSAEDELGVTVGVSPPEDELGAATT
ncbi:hypothetical protein R83H12_00152 [Fibrobacteria bacterium R8-3-H12]